MSFDVSTEHYTKQKSNIPNPQTLKPPSRTSTIPHIKSTEPPFQTETNPQASCMYTANPNYAAKNDNLPSYNTKQLLAFRYRPQARRTQDSAPAVTKDISRRHSLPQTLPTIGPSHQPSPILRTPSSSRRNPFKKKEPTRCHCF